MMQITQTLDRFQQIKSGAISIFDYIDMAEAYFDEREPEVLAFVPETGRFERLRSEAQKLLEQYPDVERRPPLFGLLIGVKDIFHVAGLPTHAGSQLSPEVLAGAEAESVTKLRDAGALVLGKTVTTEFAYFGPGPTRNPHHPNHTPGGSSSGSAAAVGAGLSRLTLGTQTIGSVNRPASFCGVVGYKPSYNRISKEGVIPLSKSLDHVGLFAPEVAKIKTAASLLCHDWDDGETTGLQVPVLGMPIGPYLNYADAEGTAQYQAVCEKFIKQGIKIKQIETFANYEEIRHDHYVLMAAEAAQFHDEWFQQYRDLYHEKTVELILDGQKYSREAIQFARENRVKLRNQLTLLMGQHEIDFWITPSAPGYAPEGLASTGNPIMNLPWTNAGLPSLTLPAAYSEDGLPFGIQLVGNWGADEQLLDAGIFFEEKLKEE